MKKSLQERIARVVREHVAIVSYNAEWPQLFEEEARFLRDTFPDVLIRRVEHFGSTAVPGLAAKPIVDMLVEVASLDETKRVIVPDLESRGYDYFWRPELFEDPPFYAWFIKRDPHGTRTHHIHMVEADSALWDRLRFRDYLRAHPDAAAEYAALKQSLAQEHPNDRVAYIRGKSEFIMGLSGRT
ncbi:MAG: GrpB family protein [bacterium]|nr:GrpB family protein [bacterium]